MPFLRKHGLVTNNEYFHLTHPSTAPSEGAQHLLQYLKSKGEGTLQRFLCCLNSATEHAGHKDTATELTELLKRYHGLQIQFCSLCTSHIS